MSVPSSVSRASCCLSAEIWGSRRGAGRDFKIRCAHIICGSPRGCVGPFPRATGGCPRPW
ncbi:hypothetical protein BTZ20_1886 [Rhodococcus sp. MTM3W5.2]|nr:hypothetical protein BTZ20_1886 [Rhodococcus sp. MTM3W5.2]